MKGSLSAAEVHKQYSEGVTAFRRQIADATLRVKFTQEADVFLRACALGVWQRDGASLTPRHVEYYNAIYTKGNPAPSILFWELSTAVSEYPGFRVPDFFARMRACDKVSGTHLARRFIDLVTLMLLLFAAVDDVVSEEEAGFVNTCADTLSALCDRDGLKGEKAPLDVKDFVTRRPAPPKADAPAAAAAPAGAGQAAAAAGEEAEPAPSLEELMAELDGLCGLDKVKADVKSLINLVKVRRLRQEHGLPVPPMSLHLVFLGNPGTGKTTVARLLAKIYRAIGVLSKGQLVEVDRSGLVAGFVGQTALKTGEVIEKALGGVLFIDEAYALNGGGANDFGQEAIDTLLKAMEDHRDDLVVIVAGYDGLMDEFIHSNPGLESRFNRFLHFADYTAEELLAIFRMQCEKGCYILEPEAEAPLRSLLERRMADAASFGNARGVRNLFEQILVRQAGRLAGQASVNREDLTRITAADVEAVGRANDLEAKER